MGHEHQLGWHIPTLKVYSVEQHINQLSVRVVREFILEKLFRGSIVNYRTFFMEEGGKVYYRFGRNSICSAITIEKMAEILPRHPVLRKKFMQFKKTTVL